MSGLCRGLPLLRQHRIRGRLLFPRLHSRGQRFLCWFHPERPPRFSEETRLSSFLNLQTLSSGTEEMQSESRYCKVYFGVSVTFLWLFYTSPQHFSSVFLGNVFFKKKIKGIFSNVNTWRPSTYLALNWVILWVIPTVHVLKYGVYSSQRNVIYKETIGLFCWFPVSITAHIFFMLCDCRCLYKTISICMGSMLHNSITQYLTKWSLSTGDKHLSFLLDQIWGAKGSNEVLVLIKMSQFNILNVFFCVT